MTNNSDQIRQLTNRVHFAGKLAELSKKIEGTTSTDGVPYISFNGVIQCGETPVYSVRFKTFVKSKKADGSDSKLFARVKKWYDSAVPMTENPENPTMVDAVGSITDNPYVNAENKLIEATQYNLNLLGDFKDYAAEIDLEGYIYNIVDETKGEDETPTGRKRMRFITRDIFRNTLDLKSIVIPEELIEGIEDAGWEKGATALVRMELQPHGSTAAPAKSGFGKQHTTTGKEYLEMVVVGGEQAIDEDSERALDKKIIKAAMDERKAKLEEVENEGYKGTKNANTSRQGFGNKPAKKVVADDFLDDEMPF